MCSNKKGWDIIVPWRFSELRRPTVLELRTQSSRPRPRTSYWSPRRRPGTSSMYINVRKTIGLQQKIPSCLKPKPLANNKTTKFRLSALFQRIQADVVVIWWTNAAPRTTSEAKGKAKDSKSDAKAKAWAHAYAKIKLR